MVNLIWNGKKGNDFKLDNIKPFHNLDIYSFTDKNNELLDNWENLLIWGENESVINTLMNEFRNKLSLIYIDPPFATGGDFNFKIQIGERGKFIEKTSYTDKWEKGLDSYLTFLHRRLLKMKKLLAQNGSIFVHLDWHISHYIKLVMDDIFGINNFRNEIIWAYPAASVKTRRFFIRSYDTLLFYSKTEDYVFKDDPKIYMEYSNRVKDALKKDEHGTFYYRGGSHNGKKLSRKVYVEQNGIFPRDVWNDIPYIRANTPEYQGFSTQKPERLLKRIILACTNEKDIVADFFCGSGTTLAVAEKLGRRWIGCDMNKHAIHISRKRILNINKSNNLLNWKENYKRNPNSFRVISLNKEEQIISKEFLEKDSFKNNVSSKFEPPEINVKIHQNNKNVIIELLNYTIPYKKVISNKIRSKITSFSDFIDYWAIDYNFQNQTFNNKWVSFRSGKKRELELKSKPYTYEENGLYNLSVKVIDIFGIITQKSYKITI
ncbi:MAG: site-specific DNA-methyltransferase [Promethearchaeota archaeon]